MCCGGAPVLHGVFPSLVMQLDLLCSLGSVPLLAMIGWHQSLGLLIGWLAVLFWRHGGLGGTGGNMLCLLEFIIACWMSVTKTFSLQYKYRVFH